MIIRDNKSIRNKNFKENKMSNEELYYRQAESKAREIDNGADMESVENAQAAYRECVAACIQIFKKREITYLSKNDVSRLGFASGIENTLFEAVKVEILNLEDEGVDLDIRGDDCDKFFAEQYAILKHKPRIITNPSTYEALGKEV